MSVKSSIIRLKNSATVAQTEVSTSVLCLPLKTQLFEMTKSGIKKEDYRDITPYWCKRFLIYKWEITPELPLTIQDLTDIAFKPFTTNIMTLGYPKSTSNERILKLEHKGIEIRTGNPDWGAEPNKLYFVILHGKIIV